MYLVYTRAALVSSVKDLYAVGSAVVFAYVVNIFCALLDTFAIPTMLAAFLIVPIGKRRDAFIGNLFCNFLIAGTLLTEYVYSAGAALDVYVILEITLTFVVGVVGGTVAAYTLSNKVGRFKYLIKGLIIGAVCYGVMLLMRAFQGLYQDAAGVHSDAAAFFDRYFKGHLAYALIPALAPVSLGLFMQPLFERTFNLITDSRLVELTDHNAPLIKRLRSEAPGTFSHSLAVASFAEMCAGAIGENPYLARAAAYYHDVGKLDNPQYYKENQVEVNLHDELLPEVSAEIIRSHTSDGLTLCNKYRIPHEVSHVVMQHHGTLLIPVFYEKAKKLTDTEIDPYDYSHHGTPPKTKIAAIIMLCDASEAAIRAMDAPDGEKVDKLLIGLINDRIAKGQFDDCAISMRDLTAIKNTIISAYGGLYHKRLRYPGGETAK
jgi:putative nucleotidyltransferase with HDIG domain